MKTSEQSEKLLERLRRGETAAAAELYTAYAAYLRTIVRRQLSAQLRTQFDSADVVQSIWVQIVRQISSLNWRLETEGQLRALLGVVARRRVFTRARSPIASNVGKAISSEVLDEIPATDPRPSHVVQANELWDTMLELCAPEHREVLRLRREGYTLTEIATRMGMHEGSIRRILRQLSRELALKKGPLSHHVEGAL